MSKTLTITLPDDLIQALTEVEQKTNQTTEEIVLQLLTKELISSPTALETDPLLALAGCITSDVPNVADNHDEYIGQALYDEIHSNE